MNPILPETNTQRRLVWLAAAACVASSLGCIEWVAGPLPEAVDVNRRSPQAAGPITIRNQDVRAGASLAAFDRTLRGPLMEIPEPNPKIVRRPAPKPSTPKPKPKPAPRINWTLVGTIAGPAGSVAIVSDSSGQFDISGEGESPALSPAGVTITKIDSDRIT
ncbi:MAG: hypothetical protein AAF958_16220, partial [Planctomycetota bacterium]